MSEIKRRWPESIDANGVLSRGKCFVWRGWCVDFIRARGVAWGALVGPSSVCVQPSDAATYKLVAGVLQIALFGHVLIIGRKRA